MSRRIEIECGEKRAAADLRVEKGFLPAVEGAEGPHAIVAETAGEVLVEGPLGLSRLRFVRDGLDLWVSTSAGVFRFRRALPLADRDAKGHDGDHATLTAPMTGRVVKVAGQGGDEVTEGDVVVVVEAMKMEHPLRAPFTGVVEEIACSVGATVDMGQVLARLKRASRE